MWTLLIIVVSTGGPPSFVAIPNFVSPVSCNDAGRKAVREFKEFSEKLKVSSYEVTFTCLSK